jgi:membrane protease YdiL (CAAX protease family)
MESRLVRQLPVGMQLITLALFCLICIFIGATLGLVVESKAGFSIATASQEVLNENRGALRLFLFFNNAFMFFFPAILFSSLLYKKEWLTSASADILPKLTSIIISILIIFASVGLIEYLFHMNSSLSLPQWMIDAELRSKEIVGVVLTMDSVWELLANLFIVALIPAIGEEWFFRGILQDRLLKIVKNEHLAVWIVAIIFSAVHMQFQGFLPRVLLGAILGYMFVWSRSLWLPIIAHFFNNGFQVMYFYFSKNREEALDMSSSIEIIWWKVLLSFIGTIVLMLILKFINNKRNAIQA